MLTGVDITSWGSDLPGRPRLGNLVRQILDAVQDLPRLRLSSIDPAEPDAELMDVLAEDQRLLPHLHLSLQHGDDLILKRICLDFLRNWLIPINLTQSAIAHRARFCSFCVTICDRSRSYLAFPFFSSRLLRRSRFF